MKNIGRGKIKVLHIIAFRAIGGAERALLMLSSKIDQEKFDLVLGIFVSQRKNTGPLWKEAEKLDLPLEPIRIKNPYGLLQILDIFRIIRKHHPDIIHTHGYKTNLLGFLFAKLFGIPIVATLHGWLYSNITRTKLITRASFMFMKHFDRVIAVSEQIRAGLERLKIPSRKIVIIKNVPFSSGNECSIKPRGLRQKLGLPPNSKLIGFVGRLEPVKGCALFIQAISQLAGSHSDYHFVIVGEGPERESLERQARGLDLEKQIYFCGFCDDITAIFKSLDLYVLPSLGEGIPLALLEAMAHGVPVIATSVGGVPEVIEDRINGILVPPNNPSLLAESIVESLSNQDETARRVLAAKKTIDKRHNVQKWAQSIQEIYEELSQV